MKVSKNFKNSRTVPKMYEGTLIIIFDDSKALNSKEV
jgi:hypothetical protein